MTVEFFRAQMHRLSGLRFAPADFETHWEGLSDVPEAILEAAVGRALKTRVEFPTPFELRVDADLVKVNQPDDESERRTPLAEPQRIVYPNADLDVTVRYAWRYDCDVCCDLGWHTVWCGNIKAPQRKPWEEPYTCERRQSHAPHQWVKRCLCVETNPTLIRRRDAARKYAEKPGKAA